MIPLYVFTEGEADLSGLRFLTMRGAKRAFAGRPPLSSPPRIGGFMRCKPTVSVAV